MSGISPAGWPGKAAEISGMSTIVTHRTVFLAACLLLFVSAGSRAWGAPLQPRVVQGTVVVTTGHFLTIHTRDIRPRRIPGQMTPMFIVAGKQIRVDVSHAVFENADGSTTPAFPIAVGESVVAVLRGCAKPLRAGQTYHPLVVEVVTPAPTR